MEFTRNTHSDIYHVTDQLQDNIERILNGQTTAASSFIDHQTRDVLLKRTISVCQPIIDAFLCDYNGPSRLTLTHAFTKHDAKLLGVPTTHLGVLLDRETKRLWVVSTTLVSVVIFRDRNATLGYRIDNVYPNVASTKYGKKLKLDPLPYVMLSPSWKKMNSLRRTMWRVRCNHESEYATDYDEYRNGILLNIESNNQDVGYVIVTNDCDIWYVKNDKPFSTKHHEHTSLLQHAFPQTLDNLRDLRGFMRQQSYDDSLNININDVLQDVIDPHTLIRDNPKSNDQTSDDTTTQDEELTQEERDALLRKADRNRKRALSRSRQTKAKPKRAKTKEKTKRQRTEPTKAFEFKHVPTRLETEGLSQAEMNEIVCEETVQKFVPYADNRSDEMLVTWPSLAKVGKALLCHMSQSDRKSVIDMFDAANNDLRDCENSMYYPPELKEFVTERASDMHTIDTVAFTKAIRMISQDSHWQPLVSGKLCEWIDTHVTDSKKRKLKRNATMDGDISLFELLEDSLQDFDATCESAEDMIMRHALPRTTKNDNTTSYNVSPERLASIDNIFKSLGRTSIEPTETIKRFTR